MREFDVLINSFTNYFPTCHDPPEKHSAILYCHRARGDMVRGQLPPRVPPPQWHMLQLTRPTTADNDA